MENEELTSKETTARDIQTEMGLTDEKKPVFGFSEVAIVTTEEIEQSTAHVQVVEGTDAVKEKTKKKKCILLITIGSRGDVNPFLAVGEEFQRRGYHVRLATHEAFQQVVEKYGFEFCKLAGDPKVLMNLMSKSDSISNPTMLAKNYVTYRKILRGVLDDIWHHISKVPSNLELKAVVANPVSHCGVHIAEFLHVPAVMLFTMPWTKSRDLPFPLYMTDVGKLSGVFLSKEHSYGLFEKAMWFSIKDIVNDFRQDKLGLPPKSFLSSESGSSNVEIHGRHVPFLYCWSKRVIPKPACWGSHIMISGYLITKDDQNELLAFHKHQDELYAKQQQNQPQGQVEIEDEEQVRAEEVLEEKEGGKREQSSVPVQQAEQDAIQGFTNSKDLDKFLARAAKNDPLGPLYIGFGSINAEPSLMEEVFAAITRALHFLACKQGVDGKAGVLGTRYIIIQAVNHYELIEKVLHDTKNMCTIQRRKGLFRGSEPFLSTEMDKKTVDDISTVQENSPTSSPRSCQSSSSSVSNGGGVSFLWQDWVKAKISSEEALKAWDDLHSRLILLREAKHSALFPQCSLVVHHGGAGTFMTSVHAGVPQLVVPFFGDQFLWSGVVLDRGLGEGLSAENFDVLQFLERIDVCLSDSVNEKAKQLGRELRDELRVESDRGVVRAANAIEAWLDHEDDYFDLDMERAREEGGEQHVHGTMPSEPAVQEGEFADKSFWREFQDLLGIPSNEPEYRPVTTVDLNETKPSEKQLKLIENEARIDDKARGCSGGECSIQ